MKTKNMRHNFQKLCFHSPHNDAENGILKCIHLEDCLQKAQIVKKKIHFKMYPINVDIALHLHLCIWQSIFSKVTCIALKLYVLQIFSCILWESNPMPLALQAP